MHLFSAKSQFTGIRPNGPSSGLVESLCPIRLVETASLLPPKNFPAPTEMKKHRQPPALHTLYREYLVSQDLDAFAVQVSTRYTVGTLERLTLTGDRMARRAAVLAVGRLADFSSNAVLGRALTDNDRGVRMLADNGIRLLWCRIGNEQEQSRLDDVIELICARRFQAAIEG